MSKNKTEEVEQENVDRAKVEKQEIGTLSLDFGREDLNQLRDKINEVIARLNA